MPRPDADPYAPLNAYVAPAGERAEYWRIGATFGLTAIAYVIMVQTVMTLLVKVMGPVWAAAVQQLMEGGRNPGAVLAVLFSFLPLALALGLAVRLFHDRSWKTLLGPLASTRAGVLRVALGVLALQVVLLPLQVMAPNVGRHLTLAQQAPWILPALLGILIQTATEEALFRGYLIQQLGARSRNPLVWMGLPAAVFALLHLDTGAALPEQIWTCGSALVFALAAADLTARTGTLGPAIGLHLANNIGAILGVGLYGQMDGMAAWNLVLNPLQPWSALPYMGLDLLGLLVAWLLARLILRV